MLRAHYGGNREVNHNLARRVAAEGLATAFLVAAVVGSGIMAERLSGNNGALALLANTLATGAALVSLILGFGGISGAHMNPVVTLSFLFGDKLNWRDAAGYVPAQFIGGIAGTIAAHLMFGLPPILVSRHARAGAAQVFSEFVATFGLVMVVRSCARFQPRLIAFAVGSYIAAAYWFTASTSFANPAVTVARSLSDTFSGIRPADVPPFLLAQLAGALSATALVRWLIPDMRNSDD